MDVEVGMEVEVEVEVECCEMGWSGMTTNEVQMIEEVSVYVRREEMPTIAIVWWTTM